MAVTNYEYIVDITKELLDSIEVGDKVLCNDWKRPMKVIAVSKNYFISATKRFYSICEKLPRKFTHNYAYEGKFTIGPDNYYGYYNYANKDECEDALLRLEDGYNYSPLASEHKEWEKTISPITKKLGHLELGRNAVSLNRIAIIKGKKK